MSAGDWWDESWTPVVGCDMSLPCAERCWARRQAHMHAHHPNPKIAARYAGITDDQGRWTGKLRLNERELERPLHWRNPRVVAVTLMGDLFLAPDAWLDRIYAVMALCPQHRFMVLTKRAEQRVAYLQHSTTPGRIWPHSIARPSARKAREPGWQWPLPNVIEMISVSTQAELDERWPWLAKTPAAMRGLHIEPLLGPLNLGLLGTVPKDISPRYRLVADFTDWVVMGGETGPGARPMHPQSVRDIRDQCRAAGVPFWFKNWGTHPLVEAVTEAVHEIYRMPRKRAGRLLDGQEHNEVPWER